MTEQILGEREIEYFISDWKLVPTTGGKFELISNGEVLFSKKAIGRHAEEGEIRAAIMKALDAIRPSDFTLPKKD